MKKLKIALAAFAVATIATGCDPQNYVNATGPTGDPMAAPADYSVGEPPTSQHDPNPGGFIHNGNQTVPCDPLPSPEYK